MTATTRPLSVFAIAFLAAVSACGARSIVVPEMPAGSNGSGPGVYAQILKEAGAWQYTAPGSYFRCHGDVFLFHTETPGTHAIALPDDVAKVRELFTGAEFDSNQITLETDGPQTWLFRATPRGDWSVGEPAERAARRNGP